MIMKKEGSGGRDEIDEELEEVAQDDKRERS